ncbi:495_t:CDS:2, partial [Funneliformis geosporum]
SHSLKGQIQGLANNICKTYLSSPGILDKDRADSYPKSDLTNPGAYPRFEFMLGVDRNTSKQYEPNTNIYNHVSKDHAESFPISALDSSFMLGEDATLRGSSHSLKGQIQGLANIIC